MSMYSKHLDEEVEREKPKIEKITVEKILDDCPDISYLETIQDESGNILSSCQFTQEEWLENPEQVQGYIDANKKRLEEFSKGEVYMVGIRAKVEVSYRINERTEDRRIEHFTSGGLWGIESDSGDDYFKEVQADELADLKSHLEQFNVDISNFDELAQVAESEGL